MPRSLSPAYIRDTRSAGITAPVDDEWTEWQRNPTAHGPARHRAPPAFVRAVGEYDERGQVKGLMAGPVAINKPDPPERLSTAAWYTEFNHASSSKTSGSTVAPTTSLNSITEPRPLASDIEVIDLTGDSPPPSPTPNKPSTLPVRARRDWFATPRAVYKPAAVPISRIPSVAVRGPHYALDDDNKGHQLLKNMGWQGQAFGQGGRTAPVATTLKLDRRGLGRDTVVAKVTHTQRDLNRARTRGGTGGRRDRRADGRDMKEN